MSIFSMLLIIVKTVAFLVVTLSRPMIVWSVYTIQWRFSDQWSGFVFNRVAGTEHSFYLFPCNNFVGGGSGRILSLCTDMHWVKTNTNLPPFAVCYQVDSVFHSFFQITCVQHEIFFYFRTVMFFITFFALSANVINRSLGIFCRNQSFPFCAFYRCADFSQYFRIFPCFYEYKHQNQWQLLGFFFGRFVYSAYCEVAFYQSWLQFLKLEILDIYTIL